MSAFFANFDSTLVLKIVFFLMVASKNPPAIVCVTLCGYSLDFKGMDFSASNMVASAWFVVRRSGCRQVTKHWFDARMQMMGLCGLVASPEIWWTPFFLEIVFWRNVVTGCKYNCLNCITMLMEDIRLYNHLACITNNLVNNGRNYQRFNWWVCRISEPPTTTPNGRRGLEANSGWKVNAGEHAAISPMGRSYDSDAMQNEVKSQGWVKKQLLKHDFHILDGRNCHPNMFFIYLLH